MVIIISDSDSVIIVQFFKKPISVGRLHICWFQHTHSNKSQHRSAINILDGIYSIPLSTSFQAHNADWVTGERH